MDNRKLQVKQLILQGMASYEEAKRWDHDLEEMQRCKNEGILCWIQALRKDPSNKQCQSLLGKRSKDAIFAAILSCNADAQKILLHESLDEDTPLGRLFWKQQGVKPCSLESGTLKKIFDHLETIDPVFKKQNEKNVEDKKEFITAVKGVVGDLNFWQEQGKGMFGGKKTPGGITKIRAILANWDEESAKSTKAVFEELRTFGNEKCNSKSGDRSGNTAKLYRALSLALKGNILLAQIKIAQDSQLNVEQASTQPRNIPGNGL